MLKDRTYGHTRVLDEDLLEKTGMDAEFVIVWKAEISKSGSLDLTIQFLCTLVLKGICP